MSGPTHHVGLRYRWESMDEAQRVEHLSKPTHLFAYMSSFVPRGTTEGSIKRYFACINHLGALRGGSPTKLELSASACGPIAAALDTLIVATRQTEASALVDNDALDNILLIRRLVEAEVETQGWSYDHDENFAYRTAGGPDA